MELTLTDITGTLGEWLEGDISLEVPLAVIKAIETAYLLAIDELEKK